MVLFLVLSVRLCGLRARIDPERPQVILQCDPDMI
jgi:hypothetical protein